MSILKEIKPVLGQILKSKKALALISGGIIWALAQAGIVASPEQILPVLGLISAYILGQGVADVGKEKAKIEAAAIAELPANPT